jgi:biotin carboxyl carrier protein
MENLMSRTILDIDGKQVQVFFEVIEGTLWVHALGETWATETAKAKRKSARSHQDPGAGGHVKAPMPGKILKIMIKAGDKVSAQQTVAAMEAMKMEYSLRSSVEGTVKEIKCREGQQVSLGETLIEIEENK